MLGNKGAADRPLSSRKSKKERRKKYLSRECVVSACVRASVRVRVSAGLDDVHALLELARIERLEVRCA